MKKILNILISLSLLTSMQISVFALEHNAVTIEELTQEQISELYEYGIFRGNENGDLLLDNNITRAEFCKVILSSLGYTENSLKKIDGMSDFSDVDDSHWAYLYIQNAKNLSLIDGYEDGSFRPEENITLNEAIKIVVSALGYEPLTNMLGGYPKGYQTVAEQLELLNNVESLPEDYVLRNDVAKIIVAALDVPIAVSTEDNNYMVMDGTNGAETITWGMIIIGEAEK